ncbi:hypothetical protein FRC04_004655 [Tulasnella sp. 424]|nr:hypothetical protein FRC04_004655 [Tulasnella sp. 424]
MTTIDYPDAEEAIDALLREHAIAGDPEEAEVETQFQSLQRKLDALESQLMILNEAKKATRKGDFNSRPRTFDLLGRDQGLTGSIGSLYGNTTGARYRTPGLVDHDFSQRNFAIASQAPNLLDWRMHRVERVDAEGYNLGVVPVPQALKIHEWCQETIESIAPRLTPDQIK